MTGTKSVGSPAHVAGISRRPDVTDDAVLDTTAAVDLRYGYDATDDRTIKTAVDPDGNAVHTLYPIDALELRRAAWDSNDGDYARTTQTEVPYLFAHGTRLGRVASAEEDLPSATSGASHVFLELMDHLGIDEPRHRSRYERARRGEHIPRLRGRRRRLSPERWKSFREDYRFYGKEEDVEVGLQYFGKRYLATSLGRWASPDPLNVHALQADLNTYAYVHGSVLRAVDPTGLESLPGGTGNDGHVAPDTTKQDEAAAAAATARRRRTKKHIESRMRGVKKRLSAKQMCVL